MSKIYVCIYCDDERGTPEAATYCDQRPQAGEFAHVWQVIRTSAGADRAEWELRFGN